MQQTVRGLKSLAWSTALQPIQPWTFRQDYKKKGQSGGCGGGGERGWGWLPTWRWLSRMIEIWGRVYKTRLKDSKSIRDLKFPNDLYSNKFSHPWNLGVTVQDTNTLQTRNLNKTYKYPSV